ncbi:MAG: sugar phosphate isomerase/epimerase family protein [Verrucomicrobiota bacterium]
MRFGLNTFLVSPGFTNADLPLIETFKSYGAEAVELAIVDPESVDPIRLKDQLEVAGLDEPVICGAFGPGRDLRGSPQDCAATVHYVCELIDLAVSLNSKVICGPFYSETGRTGSHTESERARQRAQICDALRPLCAKAEDAGVILALEPLNRFETDCINTLGQATELINEVGSNALKIHLDTFHMNIEEMDSGEAIRQAGSLIGHVHASASHRGLLGHDQVDWDGVLGALSDIDYDGDIIIESFSEENHVIAKAASIWRQLYDSPEQLATEGLQFLRTKWKAIENSKRVEV